MRFRIVRYLTSKGAAVALALCVAVMAASPATADWRRAESPRFVVYSEGSERQLRDYVGKLETFDYFLRMRFNMPQGVPTRPLPIYLVGSARGMSQIRPGLDDTVAGFYVPTSEGIFAVALREGDDDYLFHEYFHHFSFQAGAATGYPGWLVEGLAEYYMTVEVEDDAITIGNFNSDRAMWLLNSSWIPLEELISIRPAEARRGSNRNTYYPVAGLLTHWFLSDQARAGQLRAYVADIQTGTASVTAMEKATGLTMAQLRQALRSYISGRVVAYRIDVDAPTPQITITRLDRSADDLLLLGQRLKIGAPETQRASTAALVRRAAAKHPDNPFAMLQLGHAELHFGDPVVGEAILTRLLELELENVEALQLLATRRSREAVERPQEADSLLRRGRAFLARAYQIDPDDYRTLYLLAKSREGAADYPNENDIVTWDQAFLLAPQLPGVRLGYAAALMQTSQFESAERILVPLASASHGGAAIEAAQILLERASAGQPPLAPGTIDAATEADQAEPVVPSEPEPTIGDDDADGSSSLAPTP